jgi:hypothetical protein
MSSKGDIKYSLFVFVAVIELTLIDQTFAFDLLLYCSMAWSRVYYLIIRLVDVTGFVVILRKHRNIYPIVRVSMRNRLYLLTWLLSAKGYMQNVPQHT